MFLSSQGWVCITLLWMVICFITDRFRYDIIAISGLLFLVLMGIIPAHDAFQGMSNPAVITVAEVMVLSAALSESVMMDKLLAFLLPYMKSPLGHLSCLCFLSAILSAFMNNVGALGIVLPIALKTAHMQNRSPAMLLMPVAFSSILGGLATEIGTPPNLLISQYRASVTGQPFGLFDFFPVGGLAALLGVLFIIVLGWRLIPKERLTHQIPEELAQSEDLSDEASFSEAVVSPRSPLAGKSIKGKRRYKVQIAALSRQGKLINAVPETFKLEAGDILLLKGSEEGLNLFSKTHRLMPLVNQKSPFPSQRSGVWILIGFLAGILLSAFHVTPLPIGLAVSIALLSLFNVLDPQRLYESVDWSVLVLLAAMLPISGAFLKTGATDTLTQGILHLGAGSSPMLSLALLSLVTMLLTDLMNNTATALLMAPVAMTLARALHCSADPFLMIVSIASSCAFLTPVGHQNNTLILGPGGYRFHDFWRMGLPLGLLVQVVSLVMVTWVWPF